jgi:ABC-type phosphate/phosphonate transport system substrate-binding protein
MKNKLLLCAVVFISIFSGCGGGGESSNKKSSANVNQIQNGIKMEQNRVYFIEKGDEIKKISSNPVIKIEAELGSNKTKVTLISGEALIIEH